MTQQQPGPDACFRQNHVLASIVILAFSFVIAVEVWLLVFHSVRHSGPKYTELAAGLLGLVVLGQAYRFVPCKAEKGVIVCGGFVVFLELIEPYLPYMARMTAGSFLIVASLVGISLSLLHLRKNAAHSKKQVPGPIIPPART